MATKLTYAVLAIVALTANVQAQPVPGVGSGSGAGSAAPPPAPAPLSPAAATTESKAVTTAFSSDSTLHGGGVASELLQIVGQIVVDRATQAGWSILLGKVKTSLGCSKEDTKYPKTCE